MLEARLGRTPNAEEQAQELGIPVSEFHEMAHNALSVQLQSLDETIGEHRVDRIDLVTDDSHDPLENVEAIDMRQRLALAIQELPERDQLLLSLYYKEELNLKEIGKVLGVSESRVSQLHSQAALKLRSKLIEK
jgi:RNA polymerase sigma factor for flagellar operon FliA